MNRICAKCQAEAADDFRFCETCGTPLPPLAATPPVAAMPSVAVAPTVGALPPFAALPPGAATPPFASPPPVAEASPVGAMSPVAAAPTVDEVPPVAAISDTERLRKAFNHVVTLGPPWQEATLVEACEGDALLLADLRTLLAARETAAAQPPPIESQVPTATVPPPSNAPLIGPYRLLRELGRGGPR